MKCLPRIAAVPVTDTLKRGDADGMIAGTVERAGLWRAQTPQGFRFPDILKAHRDLAGAELTDDAAVAERAGLGVALVQGNADNLKVTNQDDMARAALTMSAALPDVRTGLGFDVHRFAPATMWCCAESKCLTKRGSTGIPTPMSACML